MKGWTSANWLKTRASGSVENQHSQQVVEWLWFLVVGFLIANQDGQDRRRGVLLSQGLLSGSFDFYHRRHRLHGQGLGWEASSLLPRHQKYLLAHETQTRPGCTTKAKRITQCTCNLTFFINITTLNTYFYNFFMFFFVFVRFLFCFRMQH